MVQSLSIAVPALYTPPPLRVTELPLTVQPVSVAVPVLNRPPPNEKVPPVLPTTVQPVSVAVP